MVQIACKYIVKLIIWMQKNIYLSFRGFVPVLWLFMSSWMGVFLCRIPLWRWLKTAETCRRLAIRLNTLVSNCCTLTGINMDYIYWNSCMPESAKGQNTSWRMSFSTVLHIKGTMASFSLRIRWRRVRLQDPAASPPGKEPLGEHTTLFTLQGIKPRFLSFPARCLVTVPTVLSKLHHTTSKRGTDDCTEHCPNTSDSNFILTVNTYDREVNDSV